MVKGDGDYKVNLLDPDVPVKWDQIEEVVNNLFTHYISEWPCRYGTRFCASLCMCYLLVLVFCFRCFYFMI